MQDRERARITTFDCAGNTGWATDTDPAGLLSGVQRTPLRRGESHGMRLLRYRRWVRELLELTCPTLVVYEAPSLHHLSAHAAELAYQFTGVVQEEAEAAGVAYTGVPPAQLKKWLTGRGNAPKPAMQDVIEERCPHYQREADPGADEADALALLLWAQAGCPEPEAAPKRSRKRQPEAGAVA